MAEGRMNLAALQQRDPYITDIVDTASQVALYTFGFDTNEWEKTSIEGSLFVYKRTASPINGFMILNRLGLNNLIEPIIKDLEFQLQDPFLLYRNSKSIYGIWFYGKDECARIGQLMNSLLQLAIENHQAKSNNAQRQRRASESDKMQDRFEMIGPESTSIDIVQMLYKAQHEYNKTKGAAAPQKNVDPKPMIDKPTALATKSTDVIRPMPLKVGGYPDSPEQAGDSNPNLTTPIAPITLETLFRNASVRQQQGGGLNFPPKGLPDKSNLPLPPVSRSLFMSEAEDPEADSRGGDLPILLKHLLGSGSMVEDIERCHRGEIPTVVPSQAIAMATAANLPIKISPKSPMERLSPHVECLGQIDTTAKKLSPRLDLSQSGSSKDLLDLSSLSINLTEPRQTSAYPIPVSKQLSPSTGQPKSASVPKENLLTPAKLDWISSQSQGGSTSLEATLGSDILLSPMAFVRSSRKSPPVPSKPILNLSELMVEKSRESETLPVAALTKDQLQQALLYLIKNDSNFIDTLHEAYLRSLKNLAGPRL